MDDTSTLVQYGWTLTCAALVLIMQAGFCCLEAGSVRHKNSINVALKNVVDLCGSFAAFFCIGYALMFGASQAGFIGHPDFFLSNLAPEDMIGFLFQVTFCSTAATIVSGGIAERCRFLPYLMMSIGLGLFIYPLFGHWVWGGGWLADLGYKDFAGSSVVHMVGAGVALAGIQVLGPRKGRFAEDGSPRRIPASSMPLVAIGVFILTFGWIGFNGGSAALSVATPTIVTNTLLAACFGGLIALLGTWAFGGLAAVDIILNGVLGGLVAVTAGADVVAPTGACLIGILGGLAVVAGTLAMERLRLDDAVGAVPVHGVAGAVGVIATPLFMTPDAFAAAQEALGGQPGLGYFVGIQSLGVLICLAWSYLAGRLLWLAIGRVTTLRVGPFEEEVGMNYSEHKVDNAIQDLTGAVAMVTGGQRRDLVTRLDNAGDGEVAELAEAVRQLLLRTERKIDQMRQWGQELQRMRSSMLEHHGQGENAAHRCLTAIEESQASVDNLVRFVDDHREHSSLLPLIGDLATVFTGKLRDLRDALPAATGAWQSIGVQIKQLDKMLRDLQGVAK